MAGKDSFEMVSSARCAKILVTDFLRFMRVPSSIRLRKGRLDVVFAWYSKRNSSRKIKNTPTLKIAQRHAET
jgi:hypothetical protein